MVSKPSFFFPTTPEEYAEKPVPSLTEWQELWKAWDAVSKQMIPNSELLAKPIKLRNECIFYLGHIPTFLDIHIARATDGKPTEPAYFWKIFERGVDPDVDDPTLCHAHSEVPEEWPPLGTILQYQQTIRKNLEALYDSGEAEKNCRISRGLWIAFEHEAMHLETLLYMLIQSDKVLPPPGIKQPDFAAFAAQSEVMAAENEWFTIPESDIDIGLNDPEKEISKESSELSIKLQATRIGHQPANSFSQTSNCILIKHLHQGFCCCLCIFVYEAANSNANNNIIGN